MRGSREVRGGTAVRWTVESLGTEGQPLFCQPPALQQQPPLATPKREK